MTTSNDRRNGSVRYLGSWLTGQVRGSVADVVDWRYERTKSRAALDSSIRAYQRAIATAPPRSAEQVRCMGNVAVCLSQRYGLTKDPADLDAAIAYDREAVDATPLLSSDHQRLMANLAGHLNRRYRLTQDLADLEDAIHFARASARETPAWKRKQAGNRWATYAQYTFEKFRQTGNTADVDAAVDAARRAVAATRPDDANRARRLADLAIDLHGRFLAAQNVADLDAALTAVTEATARLPADASSRSHCLSTLGLIESTRFERSGSQADLDRAIAVARQAVASLPPDDPDRAEPLSGLAMFLSRRYETAGAVSAFDEAREILDEALALTKDDDPDRHIISAMRGGLGWLAYERTGETASLDLVAADVDKAVAALPIGHIARAFALNSMGAIELRRYESTGDPAALEKAIAVLGEARDTTGFGSFYRHAYLSTLGVCLGRRFELNGSPADLDDAIEVLREAVAASPTRNDDPMLLTNLGIFLMRRFQRAGDRNDLEAAVDASRQAAETAGPDHRYLGMFLSNLSASLLARHARFSQPADLDEGIEAARAAVQTTARQQAHYPRYVMNLGLAHSDRFDRDGDLDDATAAIRYCREALAELPEDYGDRAFYLANLSACLDRYADETDDPVTAAEALETARAAVDGTGEDHPERARYLRAVGNALQTQYDLDRDPASLAAAFAAWREAAAVATASPDIRLEIARQWGRTAARAGMFGEAADGFSAAVHILPSVVWHGLDPVTRQQQAARWAGLAADAACCAVLSGQPELAVELLEQGRSMLWSQALNLRADLGELHDAAPELAGKFEAARAILNEQLPSPAQPLPELARTPGSPVRDLPATVLKSPRQEAVDRLRHAARDYDEALSQIHLLDGFEHYLEPTPYPELAAASAGGTVVIVNASRYGCHAIIVTPDSDRTRVLDLPGLNLDSAEEHASQMSRLLENLLRPDPPFLSRDADRRAFLDILGWLWDVIAAPVLEVLTGPDRPGPPRIWWCPTGPLVSLPLHAAGHHPVLLSQHQRSRREVRTVLSQTVSSYIPTLTALRRARGFTPSPRIRQLTVATRDTNGVVSPPVNKLTDALTELDCLARLFRPGPVNHRLLGPDATRDRVLAAMAGHDWIHFACHAGPLRTADGSMDRGFALRDGALTITDLAAQPGRRGGLAFLSACQTASGSDEHLDEALHLAAAMQFLGYRHVVATMWSVADSPAAFVTDLFYSSLAYEEDGAPIALRHAVTELQKHDPTNPFLWAPYVHIGY
jgi:hypothetical protein